ncbi:MAG: RHS repeat domain-containing protein, partial [Polaribacter sp.]
ELQDELGLDWYDITARNYTPALGRWMNIDPLAEKFVSYSPYNAMMNNPIMFIDPDGRAAMAPIYDTNGEFLGTDDQGLQGKAIVMDEKDFEQGMSHDNALKNNKGAGGLSSKEAGSKLLSHYGGLKDRPDYDGKVTFYEAIKWYNEGSGAPLFVDPKKLDFKFTTVSTVKNAKDGYIDLFPNDPLGDGGVLGAIKFTLLNENTGDVRLGNNKGRLDIYNFLPGSKTGKIADYLYPGKPKDFDIFCGGCKAKVLTPATLQAKINSLRKRRPDGANN